MLYRYLGAGRFKDNNYVASTQQFKQELLRVGRITGAPAGNLSMVRT